MMLSKFVAIATKGRVKFAAHPTPQGTPLKGVPVVGAALTRDKLGGMTTPNTTHSLPARSIGKEVEAMEIGKPEREITIEPVEAPSKPEPAPEPVVPDREPEKVPA